MASNYTTTTVSDAEGILAEDESTLNKKLLGLVLILYLSTQINVRLQRVVPTEYYHGEMGLCYILGLVAGCAA